MPKFEPPQDLPTRILNDVEMIKACYERDFSRIFKIVKRAGLYPALIARRCDLTPSRVGEVIQGQRIIKDMAVVERVADGLRIPGHMLGLMRRDWEEGGSDDSTGAVLLTPPDPAMSPKSADDLWVAASDEDLADPEFTAALIESQLPQRYKSANYFGARQPLATVNHDAKTIARLWDSANGPMRRRLLHVGSQTAEFVGWLYQDLGEFTAAGYWSDRSMEWAQEAADHHMQSYLLFRKSHQAAAQGSPARAVGLAQAAQYLPNRTPQLSALAALQEAAGHALQGDPQAALTKFDEAHELASQTYEADPDAILDTSYCTPTYVEIQRANCWIDLGDPSRAIRLFEEEIAVLPQVFRNDRSVYLARLARAYAKAGEPEPCAEAAGKALAIVAQTGSARTLAELTAVARAVPARQKVPAIAAFTERLQIVRDRLTT